MFWKKRKTDSKIKKIKLKVDDDVIRDISEYSEEYGIPVENVLIALCDSVQLDPLRKTLTARFDRTKLFNDSIAIKIKSSRY